MTDFQEVYNLYFRDVYRYSLSLCRKNKYIHFNTDTGFLTGDGNIEDRFCDRETAFAIHKVLHTLEEPYKEVFSLRAFGDLSFKQIAELFSRTLVEEHLRECPQCSGLLADLHTCVKIPEKTVDDLKPLECIQKKWKKSKWTYIQRGICFTLAALLLVAAVLTGIWYFSYAKYYYQLTKGMDKPNKEEMSLTSSDYVLERNGYRFDVCLPIVLSDSGFVRVMDEKGLVLFLYPETNGNYSFWLYMTDEDNQSYSVHIKSDMTPDFENHPFSVRSEAEAQRIIQLLIDQREAVTSILQEVQVLWGIDLLQYAP